MMEKEMIMRISIQKTTPSKQFIGLAYAAIGFLGFLLAQFDEVILRLLPRCTFLRITHLPCPSCGATRAGIFLSHFQVLNSFLENPLYFFLYVFLFFYGLNALIGVFFHKNLSVQFGRMSRRTVLFLLFSSIAANWIYLIIRKLH